MRKLSPADNETSGRATVPKEYLERDGLVDDDGNVKPANLHFNYKDTGRYELIALTDDGTPLSDQE